MTYEKVEALYEANLIKPELSYSRLSAFYNLPSESEDRL